MQKKFQLVVLLVAVVTLAWAAPVLASEITLTTYDEITFTITPLAQAPTGTFSATNFASVNGHAYYNPNNSSYDFQNTAAPGNVTATSPQIPWLPAATSTSDSTSSPMILLTQMTGWGPQPSGPASNGGIEQYLYASYGWSYTAPNTAPENSLYFLVVTDNYTDHFQLQQEAGSAFPLYHLYGLTYHQATASWPKGEGEAYVEACYYFNNTDPNPLSNFDQNVKDQLVFGVLLQLNPGEVASGSVKSFGRYYGESMVPLPGSVLLLGSGLLGLGLLRFRRKRII